MRPVPRLPNRLLATTVGSWGLCVAAGFAALTVYSQTPGAQSAPPRGESAPSWRLVMAIHPRCPCTRASLAELARLLARPGATVLCQVLVFAPEGADPSWTDSPTVASARAIPGVTVRFDPNGRTARGLGMLTSGAAVLYDRAGEPRYFGGITPARDHEGDNLGASAVRELLRGETPPITHRPVFGCALFAAASQSE